MNTQSFDYSNTLIDTNKLKETAVYSIFNTRYDDDYKTPKAANELTNVLRVCLDSV
jgi:hypothetical protein